MNTPIRSLTLAAISALVPGALMVGAATGSAAAQPTGPLVTEFRCVPSAKNFATIAARGSRVTPPMILWTRDQGGLTAHERCKSVTGNLNRAVQNSGGRLTRLSLTTGVVNSNQVICSVRNAQQTCNPNNIILTLRPDDSPQEILQQIKDFSIKANTPPITRGIQNNDVYDFGLAIDSVLSQPEPSESPAKPN
jgi:Circadian oscillating protein COP23